MIRAHPRLSRLSITFALGSALAIGAAAPTLASPAYLKLGDIKGEAMAASGAKWFVADSFSFGVEREMKESGEKGGTEDINIGVGELQEISVSKRMDKAMPKLLEPAIKGKIFASPPPGMGTLTTTVPAGTCRAGARYPTAEFGSGTQVYVMKNVVVAGCTPGSSGDSVPTEQISLNYEEVK